jgi:hypothetical protein
MGASRKRARGAAATAAPAAPAAQPWPGGTLEGLLAPLPLSEFLVAHWERAPVHLRAADAGAARFEALRAALEHVAERARAVPPVDVDELSARALALDAARCGAGGAARHGQDVRLVRCDGGADGGNGAERFSCAVGCALDAPAVAAARAAGFSVALRAANAREGTAAAAADAVGSRFSLRVAANLYATPPGGRGLAAHYDDHCALVLQLQGAKRWRVWPAACGAPLPRLFAPRCAPRTDAAPLELTLAPGDVLYLPRGHPHEAAAAEGVADSAHLTLALEVPPPFEAAAALHVAVRAAAGAAATWTPAEALLHAAVRHAGDGGGADAAALRAAALSPNLTQADAAEAPIPMAALLRGRDFGTACAAAARFAAAGNEGLAWCAWLAHLPRAPGAPRDAWRARADAMCDALEAAAALRPGSAEHAAAAAAFATLRERAATLRWPPLRAQLQALRRRYLEAHAAHAAAMRALH